MENLKVVYFSLSDKREYTEDELNKLERTTGKTREVLVEEFGIVQVCKLIVYGSLRYRDSAYNRFKDMYLLDKPLHITLIGYHKIQPATIAYPAVEPYPNAVMDAEMFFIYPDCMEIFDQYESVSTGLYKREMYGDAYIYVKGPSYPA